jgi:ribonuclease R
VREDDLNIYHYLYIKDWLSNKKYMDLWKEYNFSTFLSFDLAHGNRVGYNKQVITIDPLGSIDLDDGFSFDSDDFNYYLDIHISDPVSYFDFENSSMVKIFDEFVNRINTCYIPNSSGSNKPVHLLPENVVEYISLLEPNEKIRVRRAISFCFKINKETNQVDWSIIFTNLTNIKNHTYEDFDRKINEPGESANKLDLVNLTNTMIKLLDLKYSLINLDADISHKMIEIFMIWTNYYCGKYLKLNSELMVVRAQEQKDLPEGIDLARIPEYCRTFLNYSANYELVDNKINQELSLNHYSLGINNYSHTTSPMRRIIDMINHLQIHSCSNQIDRIKQIDINMINEKIKIQKRISNSYDLINYIKISNKFKAFVMDLKQLETKTNALLIITTTTGNFKKMINVELPENIIPINKYDLIDIEVYYNSNNFKSNKYPFSIKIIEN